MPVQTKSMLKPYVRPASGVVGDLYSRTVAGCCPLVHLLSLRFCRHASPRIKKLTNYGRLDRPGREGLLRLQAERPR